MKGKTSLGNSNLNTSDVSSQRSVCTNVSTSTQMHGLINEFKQLYQKRLKKLELQEPLSEEAVKLKVKTLESYVKDLVEQNDVLVQTIDELEKEANCRVFKLESKLQKTMTNYKDLTIKFKESDKEIKSLTFLKESLERELRSKNENTNLLQKEMERLKTSYSEAVKSLANKSKLDDSNTFNITSELHIKNLEENLSLAMKSKNDLLAEIKIKDSKIMDLQDSLRDLRHQLIEKEYQIREIDDNYNQKINELQKANFFKREDSKLNKEFLRYENEKEELKLKIDNLNHDISCLLTAFNTAKKTGKLELKITQLKETSFERFNDILLDEQKKVHFIDLNTSNIEQLKTELHHRDDMINSLQQELKIIRNNQDMLASNQPLDKEIELRKLKSEILDYKSKFDLLNDDITYKRKELNDSKLELCNLNTEIKSLKNEIQSKDNQIVILKDKLSELNLELTSSSNIPFKLNSEINTGSKISLINEDINRYEKVIADLKRHIDDIEVDKLNLNEEVNQLQLKLRNSNNSTQMGLESFKLEIKTRDELIKKLREEILNIQDKREVSLNETATEKINCESYKISQLQYKIYLQEDENVHLNNRFKMCQKEVQEWKKLYEEEHTKVESNTLQFSIYDETLNKLKDQLNESHNQNQKLTLSLNEFQKFSLENKDKLELEILRKDDEIKKLREEMKIQEVFNREKSFAIEQLTYDIESKNEKLEKSSTEVVNLKAKCDSLEKEIESFKNKLNYDTLSVHSSKISSHDSSNIIMIENENARRMMLIQKLENELKDAKQRYESAIKEVCRLESKLQTSQVDHKNENEVLNKELSKREEQIYELKMEKESSRVQLTNLEDKLNEYTLLISNLKQQNINLQCTFKSKEDQLFQFEKQIEEYQKKVKTLNDEIFRLTDEIKISSKEITTLQNSKDDLEQKLAKVCDRIFSFQEKENINSQMRNDMFNQLKVTNESLEEKFTDLKNKLAQKEKAYDFLTNDFDRIQNLLNAKSKECQQYIDVVERLETSVKIKDKTIDDLKISLQNEKGQSNQLVTNLDKEIEKLKIQNNQLNDNIRQVKIDMETYKCDNMTLNARINTFGEDKTRLLENIQKLEMQIVTLMEKNKICQQEVSNRDQSIMKLQNDNNVIQEKYLTSLDEFKIQQEELERLNSRIKKQSNERKDLELINDQLEQKLINCEKNIKELEYEMEIYKQEVTKQNKIIENIKAEWSNNVRNHEEEIKGYKQNYQILNEELAHTKTELNEFMNKITNLKQQANELSHGLDNKNEENDSLTNEVARYQKICQEQESKICQFSSELNIFKNQLENANNQIGQLALKLNDYENKYDIALRTNEKLETNIKELNESIMELKFRLNDKEQANNTLTKELSVVNQQLNEKNFDIKKLNSINETLNEEFSKLNDEFVKQSECLNLKENLVKTVQIKFDEKNQECDEIESRLVKVQSDYKAYQLKFQFTQENIDLRDNKITQLEYDIEELTNKLHLIQNQNQEILHANKTLQNDHDELVEQKRLCEKEITRLETTVSDIQMNFTSNQQHLKKEISRFESNAITLNLQIEQSNKQIDSLQDKIANLNESLRKLEDEKELLESEIGSKNDEIIKLKEYNIDLEKLNKEKDNMITEYMNEREILKNDINESRHQLQHCLAEKAHIEERFMLINKNLEQIQEEIRQKVTEFVRVEQTCQKQQTEIKTLKDRTKSYEEEINELKKFIEKLKKDLMIFKDESIGLQQENSKFKSNLFKAHHELESRKDQEKLLTEQLTQNDNLLQQLQNELRNERNKQQECHRLISQLKQQISELNNEKEANEKIVKEATSKQKDKELRLQALQQELESCQNKLRESKEETAKKDGDIKIYTLNLANSEKQRSHLSDEIEKYEEAILQFKASIETTQQQYKDCHAELIASQQQIHELKIVISTSEGNYRETLNVVAEKSKENAYLKNELNQFKQSKDQFLDQMTHYEEKYKYINSEYKKVQEESLNFQQKFKYSEQELVNLKAQIKVYDEKILQINQDLTNKDEHILSLKMEIQNLNDKLKIKTDELVKNEKDLDNLNQKCLFLTEETRKLEISLDKSRDNGERLHKESEMVIANVNSWVHEQRNNSEKLANKIREQAAAIIQLNGDKEKMNHENEVLQHQIRKLTHEAENAAFDKEKIKALQNHLNQQQMLLHQLQNRLKEYESKIAISSSEGNRTIEELQIRLKSNMENINMLNHRLNSLQRENQLQKETLEQEISLRQTLQLQLDSKNQFINSLTSGSGSIECNLNSPRTFRKSSNAQIGCSNNNNISRSVSPSKQRYSKQEKFKSEKQRANNLDQDDSPEDIGYTSTSPSRSYSITRVPLKEKKNNQSEISNNIDEYLKDHNTQQITQQIEQQSYYSIKTSHYEP